MSVLWGLATAASASTFNREVPVRQYGKEAGMMLDLGKISLGTLNYVEEKTGKKAVLAEDSEDVDKAPYNGDPEFSINTDKARALGFKFTDIHDWIYELLDYYIEG